MSIEETLAEREKQYGSFGGQAVISQRLKLVMRDNRKWEGLNWDQQEALEMIAHKIARILNGNSYYPDNWHDIAGYATLVENSLPVEDTND